MDSREELSYLRTMPLAYRSGWVLAKRNHPHEQIVANGEVKAQFDLGYADYTAKINVNTGATNEPINN